jgi:hypothetical protein
MGYDNHFLKIKYATKELRRADWDGIARVD